MSSYIRRIQKKRARDNKTYQGKPQVMIFTEDGGYKTLTPTRGWRKVSGKRVRLYS